MCHCINVMFICNEWGSTKGGLSTFNREFAVNLAKAASDRIKVHCYVCSSSEEDRLDAKKQGVNLITAQRPPGSNDPMEWLKTPPKELPTPDIVVGHGRKFGSPAYFISERTKCKWIHFVHVFCEDLGKHKLESSSTPDAIADNEEKNEQELELCEAANLVVAVGSRLQRKYGRSLPDVKVEVITPGIFENFLTRSTHVQLAEAEDFSIFMIGRGSIEDFALKGYDIVGNAVALLDRKFELTFVGSPHDEQRRIEMWFLKETNIARNQLTIRGYRDNKEMRKMFRQADVIVMPSRTEGFGLVALEAISAGVPVLVSSESGIAKTLEAVEGGRTVVVDSDKPEDWAGRIKQLSQQKPKDRHASAMRLRDKYGEIYPWKKECGRFEQMIHGLIQKPHKDTPLNYELTDQTGNVTVKVETVTSAQALKLRIDVETMAPAELNTQDRTLFSARESGGSQNGGHQEASVVPVLSGHTQSSCTGISAQHPQAPMSPIPSEREVLRLIASNYVLNTPPKCKADRDDFMAYMEKMKVIITGVDEGSLLITVKCDSLEILERLWEDYSSGHLGEVVQRCFVTEEILAELSLAELKLQTTISEEEYVACKMYFEKDPAQAGPKQQPVPEQATATATASHVPWQESSDDDINYKAKSGYVLVINNNIFPGRDDVECTRSNDDVENLINLFDDFNFRHRLEHNKSGSQMLELLRGTAEKNFSRYDCFVCVILSHGTKDWIYGTDEKVMIKIETITSLYQRNQCPSLEGKPKIFLIQACHGPLESSSLLPADADFLICFATGHQSYHQAHLGSWFISSVFDVFKEYAEREHLMDMMLRVNNRVAGFYSKESLKQMPCQVCMLRKKVFFDPKYSS